MPNVSQRRHGQPNPRRRTHHDKYADQARRQRCRCPQRVRRAITLDAGGGGAGHLHDVPGQQHRQRGHPGHRTRSAPDHVRTGMGGQLVHPGVRQPAAGRRPAGRRLGPQAAVPDRAVGVHGGLARRGVGRERRRPGHQPSGAGTRRGPGHADHAGDHLGHLHQPAATGGRGRDLERCRCARPRGGSAARRRAQPVPQLGLDLLRQRAGRPGDAGPGCCRDSGIPGQRRTPSPRPARGDHLGRRAVRADLRADRGPRPRLDLTR